MRLLHTSDWHLGQSLHNFERHYEHQRFLDWLLDTIAAEQAATLDLIAALQPQRVIPGHGAPFTDSPRPRACLRWKSSVGGPA